MSKKYKIPVITLIFALCFIFIGKDGGYAYADIVVNRDNLQMPLFNKHNTFNNSGTKYIAHRGVSGFAPENTAPAFELAGKLGFWGVECDVRTTCDGNWMILHDATVDRMTNGTGQIKNLTISMVESLNITSGENISNYMGTKIPKLKDYLLICKKWKMISVIEMKSTDNLQYYSNFIKTIKKYGNIKKTVVISSSSVSLSELRKLDAHLNLGLICPNIIDSNIYFVKTLRNAFIDTPYPDITLSKVILCHENNIKVGVWTVDDEILANSLIEKEVDYLTTNKLLPKIKK